MSKSAVICRADGVSRRFSHRDGAVLAVNELDLTVSAGELLAIQGASGSGKSTLLLMLGGLLPPDSGQVLIDGTDPYALSASARGHFRATNVGFVFQQFHLLPYLAAAQNIMVAGLHDGSATIARATELLTRFGLQDRLGHKPDALSVGEQQRVALARAVCNNPKLILADEPTGNLDAANADAAMACLRQLAEAGHAVIIVTHDARIAGLADRTIRMEGGRIAAPTASA